MWKMDTAQRLVLLVWASLGFLKKGQDDAEILSDQESLKPKSSIRSQAADRSLLCTAAVRHLPILREVLSQR